LENGNLVLDIYLDYSNANLQVSDTLVVGDLPGYLDFTIPIIWIKDSLLTSNQKIKTTIFRKKVNSHDTQITVYKRNLVFSQKHNLPKLKEKGFEYYIGYINNTNNSGLIKWE
jgi:hypothetical protein